MQERLCDVCCQASGKRGKNRRFHEPHRHPVRWEARLAARSRGCGTPRLPLWRSRGDPRGSQSYRVRKKACPSSRKESRGSGEVDRERYLAYLQAVIYAFAADDDAVIAGRVAPFSSTASITPCGCASPPGQVRASRLAEAKIPLDEAEERISLRQRFGSSPRSALRGRVQRSAVLRRRVEH
jgi:hypothetical protein